MLVNCSKGSTLVHRISAILTLNTNNARCTLCAVETTTGVQLHQNLLAVFILLRLFQLWTVCVVLLA